MQCCLSYGHNKGCLYYYLVQFRVIVVTHTLKPYEGKLEKVVIENPSGSRMRQWTDVALEEGVFFTVFPRSS